MKKMTKILSLTLAIAMVLGMTAFAGTPTKIIYHDDFSSYADADAFKATTTTATKKFLAPAGTTEKIDGVEVTYYPTFADIAPLRTEDKIGTPAYNRFLANPSKLAVYKENGKTYIGDNMKKGWKDANGGVIVFGAMLDEAWDVTENPGKALVFTTVANNYGADTAASYRAPWTLISGFGKSYTLDAANTEGDWVGYAVDEEGNPVLNDGRISQLLGSSIPKKADTGTGDPYTFIAFNNSGTIFQRNDENPRPFVIGEDYNISTVFLPVAGTTNYTFDLGNTKGILSAEPKSFRATTLADFRFAYGLDNETTNYRDVQGIVLNTYSYVDTRYRDGMTFYEMSIDPADFYIDETKTVKTNIALDGAMKVVFSQPIVSGRDGARASGKPQTYMDEQIVVAKGEEVLTLNEDYTMEIDQEIKDGAVYGTVTVNPVGEWDYETNYTVTFPTNTYNILGLALPAAVDHVVTFATEKAPTFTFDINASEGLAAGGATVTADAMAGKTVYFTATATNASERPINGTIVIGVYDATGNLVRYAARDRAFADGETKVFSASFKMAEDETVKAFVKGTDSAIELQ